MSTPEEVTIRVQVRGTTVMAVYETQGNILLLTSADFGDAQAPLDGTSPDQAAATLLRTLAEAAMAQNEDTFMRDDGSTCPQGVTEPPVPGSRPGSR